MRKLFTLFVAAFAALSLAAGELKIGENDSQTYYAPVYATWADSYYCSQILYSANELSALQGRQITHLAFFLRAINPNGDYSNVEIRFKEVDYTAFSEAAYVSVDDALLVYDGSLPSGSAGVSNRLPVPTIPSFITMIKRHSRRALLEPLTVPISSSLIVKQLRVHARK